MILISDKVYRVNWLRRNPTIQAKQWEEPCIYGTKSVPRNGKSNFQGKIKL